MFKALYACFNIVFLIILFKIFTPGLAHLIIEFITSIFIILNNAINSVNTNIT